MPPEQTAPSLSDAMQSDPESVIEQLGELPDRKLGQAYGIQAWVMRALRIERGIKPKQPKRLPAKVLHGKPGALNTPWIPNVSIEDFSYSSPSWR